MFGRTLKLAVVVALAQLSSGCFYCCARPFFCHGICGGCAPCAAPCASCYTPTIAPSAPVVAPFPAVSVTPPTVGPMPTATSSANNPTIEKMSPFSSATYTHPVR